MAFWQLVSTLWLPESALREFEVTRIRKVKQILKKTVHKAGFDLHRVTTNSDFRLSKALAHFEIDMVFDIGANTGQFATALNSFGYQGHIVCFEPLSDAYRDLVKHTSHKPALTIHQRTAIGDFDGEIEINIAGNSASSSILPMLDIHAEADKKSAYIDVEKVPIACLDSIAPDYLSPLSRLFIKIDTQGFEWQVLNGAKETLKKAQGVLCELSFIPLYEGQHLWLEIIQRLELEGFTLWSMQSGFTDHQNGRTLQMDAVFFRAE